MGQLHHPHRRRADARRRAGRRRLQPAAVRPDHLPGHRDRRRRRERRRRAAAAPGVGEPRRRDRPVHQLARRLDHGDDRHLRHHAVRPAARGHHLRGAGGIRGGGAAGRGHARTAARCCRTPGCCCTSRRPAARARSRPRAAGPGDCSGCASRWSRYWPGTPARRGHAARRHRPGQGVHRASRPSPTGWPTRCSPRAADRSRAGRAASATGPLGGRTGRTSAGRPSGASRRRTAG